MTMDKLMKRKTVNDQLQYSSRVLVNDEIQYSNQRQMFTYQCILGLYAMSVL